jgi:hypothetical protein
MPDVRARFETARMEVRSGTAAELRRQLAADIVKWSKLVKDNAIQLVQRPVPRNSRMPIRNPQQHAYSAATCSFDRNGATSTGRPARATTMWPGGTAFQRSRSLSSGSDTITTSSAAAA